MASSSNSAVFKKSSSGFKLRSIKCPNCGASLSLFGGHKVTNVVCSYCNSLLEAGKDFKLLTQPKSKLIKPFRPLRVGQKGTIRGVSYVVIGIVQYSQYDEGEFYFWLEYLLFSPTHGYVWLCYEDCHWVLLHEIKDIPPISIGVNTPRRTPFTFRDKRFQLFECSKAKITYLEGELTWEAHIGEESVYSDSVCPPYMFCTEKRSNEIEFFYGEYIFRNEIEKAFGIKTNAPIKVGPCEPVGNPVKKAVAKAGLLCAFITMILYFIVSSGGSRIATFATSIGNNVEPYISEPILFDDPKKVYSIEFNASVDNSWAFADIMLIDEKEENNYMQLPMNVSYYHGYEGGESWSEGRKYETGYFKVPEPGRYKLVIEGGGNSGETETEAPNFSTLANITVYQGIISGGRTFWWGILLGVMSMTYWIYIGIKEGSRWAEDADDDDD